MNPAPDFDALDGTRPVAPLMGPFHGADFHTVLWHHRSLWEGGDAATVEVLSDSSGAAAVMRTAGALAMVGHEDLVDYRSPVGTGADLVAETVAKADRGTRFRFDSLPAEAADAMVSALAGADVDSVRAPHTIAAVLDLPDTFDDYMTAIGKKERHETRRKRRRFEAAIGAPRLVTYRQDDAALTRFFRMHRMAPGEKGEFMTPAMMAYFTDLAATDGWRIDGLYGDDNRMVAAAMSWSDENGYYLYNSAFDPSAGDASPGVVLISMLIEQAISEGAIVFDFLKGDETYKFRLGAEERQLYVVEGLA